MQARGKFAWLLTSCKNTNRKWLTDLKQQGGRSSAETEVGKRVFYRRGSPHPRREPQTTSTDGEGEGKTHVSRRSPFCPRPAPVPVDAST